MPTAFRENLATALTWQHQPDAAISQANPVSATLYTVLPTTRNVRILCINASVVWAVTQPTPLEVIVTIDGQPLTFTQVNPVSASNYQITIWPHLAEAAGVFQATNPTVKSFDLEGRSVRVQIRITWAVTQPTPLICRVKWARR